jgi:chemotaxis protein methyltransferase CheR
VAQPAHTASNLDAAGAEARGGRRWVAAEQRASNLTMTVNALNNFGPLLRDEEFEFIRYVMRENAGISLSDHKRSLVQSRLNSRLRALGMKSFAEYCDFVRASGPEELAHLINAMTTNVTAFFREEHHFEALAQVMLPAAMERNAATRRIRIWSAGCSTGEEPYSIAITAAEVLERTPGWDFKVLATDIDSEVIKAGTEGIYPIARMSGLSLPRLRRWFSRGTAEHEGFAKVKPELASRVVFRSLNLFSKWPMTGQFDVIFCRNVMIYFEADVADRLVGRIANLLATGGYLCIGHSEAIRNRNLPLEPVGKTAYRKSGG